jgi:hypothetical protein
VSRSRRRSATHAAAAALATLAACATAAAQPTKVVPGVTYKRLVQPGQVIDITRVSPGPLITVRPVLTGGAPTRRGRLTDAMHARLGDGAVAGVNGDYFNLKNAYPSGLLLTGGELVSEPEPSRSALLFRPDGALMSAKVQLAGTWQASTDPPSPSPLPLRTFDALNRPSERANEGIVYTPRYGKLTPTGDRVDALIALDPPGTVGVNRPIAGTVQTIHPGGGSGIGPGKLVLSGAGLAGDQITSDLAAGRRITLTPTVTGIPDGTLYGMGGGPALVQDGVPLTTTDEGFTSGQIEGRTARTGIGQMADGTILLVVAEGPQQGSRGVTAAEQATLMASLGASTAIGMDSGGSAMMAIRDSLVTPWASERPISDALIVEYSGVQLTSPAAFVSPNGDGVDESTSLVARTARGGTVRITLARPNGRAVEMLYLGSLGPSGRRIRLGARALKVRDGRYSVIARFTPSDGSSRTSDDRSFIVDRTLGFVRLRKVRKAAKTKLRISFTLSKAARVTITVRDRGGRPVTTILRDRRVGAGRRAITWTLRAGRKRLKPGIYTVSVGISSPLNPPALSARVRVTPQ